MAKLLSLVKFGKIARPELILMYGPDKVGKSTFASQSKKPIFIGTEDGTTNLQVARFPTPQTFSDVIQGITELSTDQHEYETLVIDSLDWLEPLVFEQVCRDGGKINIEDFGYGTGYKRSIAEWRKLIKVIEVLQAKRKMDVILIAHSEVKTFHDPQENAAYDRYQLKLYDKASAIFREFVDVILFVNFEVSTFKEKGDRKYKAFGEGTRKIYTERRPAFDAGNRFGLPFEIDLSWKSYIDAKNSSSGETLEELQKSIQGLVKNVSDKETLGKVSNALNKAGENTEALKTIKRKLMELSA